MSTIIVYSLFILYTFVIISIAMFLQYKTLVTIVTQLSECPREVTFDLAGRAEYREPERMERTVFVSPLSTNVSPDMVKVRAYVYNKHHVHTCTHTV